MRTRLKHEVHAKQLESARQEQGIGLQDSGQAESNHMWADNGRQVDAVHFATFVLNRSGMLTAVAPGDPLALEHNTP